MLEPAHACCKQEAEQSLIHSNTQSPLKDFERIPHTSVRNNVATLPVIYQRSLLRGEDNFIGKME